MTDWQLFSNPRSRPKRHKDVSFHVDDASGKERVFATWDEAAGFATAIAASRRPNIYLDVIIHSESGARWWGGDDAVEDYRSDPDASVSERYEIRINGMGRVP